MAESALPPEKLQRSTTRKWADYVSQSDDHVDHRLASYVLKLLSIALPVVTTFLLFWGQAGLPAAARAEQFGTLSFWIKLAVVGASVGVAIALISFAKRLRAPSALQVMKTDPRPPVLLLRAFQDDYSTVENAAPVWRNIGMNRRVLFEEVLYDIFSRCGPVIAIGRPGETDPPLGANRFWISDSRWQEAVGELLSQSQLVVIVMGRLQGREGLTWEAQTLLNSDNANKAILVMPGVEDGQARGRWEEYRALSENRLPPFEGGEVAAGFDAHGNCQVVHALPWGREFDRSEPAYRQAIRVPRRLGVWSMLAMAVLAVLWLSPLVSILLPTIQSARERVPQKQAVAILSPMDSSWSLSETTAQGRLAQFGIQVRVHVDAAHPFGLRVDKVREDSPAAQCDIRPGDILVQSAGRQVPDNPRKFYEELDASRFESYDLPPLTFYREESPQVGTPSWMLYLPACLLATFVAATLVWVIVRRRRRTDGYLDLRRRIPRAAAT